MCSVLFFARPIEPENMPNGHKSPIFFSTCVTWFIQDLNDKGEYQLTHNFSGEFEIQWPDSIKKK